MLATIGIVKDQPFAPEILDQAAKAAYKMSRVIGFEQVVGGISYNVYPDRHWANPMADGTPAKPYGDLNLSWMNTTGGYRALDSRINFFTNYYSISPGMVSYTPGRGANYVMGFIDSEGAPLSGNKSYRVNLPPNIPARIFWSMALRCRELLRSCQRTAFPVIRFARKAGTKRRWEYRPLFWSQTTRRQTKQLARDRAREGLFRDPQALRPGGKCIRQELETW
jgi:hypothetical protein